MTQPQHPLRVRLYKGRTNHAAHELQVSNGAETACDYFIDVQADNEWLPDDAPVTCRRCIRVMEREANR